MYQQTYIGMNLVLAIILTSLNLVEASYLFTTAGVILSPVIELGSLTMEATKDLTQTLKAVILHTTEQASLWTIILLVFGGITMYYMYKLFWAPMNRVKVLGDTGYIEHDKLSLKEVVNRVRKQRDIGDPPPVFPNGWFAVIESRDVHAGQVKYVSILGLNLAVFRGEDGRAHILDAYCPHMGSNLAVGGRVFGSTIECPFHGWRFRGDDGKCTHIPCSPKIPDVAKTKSYNTLERNGAIYMWYHAEGMEPYWEPPLIEAIHDGTWAYFGRTEHEVNAHIEEVPENGSDVAHLGQLHKPLLTAGTDLRYMWNRLWEFGRHEWGGGWSQDPDNKHIGALKLTHSLVLFGVHLRFLDMSVTATQIGPGIVYLTFNTVLGKGAYIHTVTPKEPLLQKVVHHCYMNWWVPPIVAKFFLWAEAVMIERDIMIWNYKRYTSKPVLVKGPEDQMISQHRRWYSQFYTENSPRLTFRKDTLEW